MSKEDISILDDAGQMLQGIVENHDLFTKLINCLPYPAQVYSPDGEVDYMQAVSNIHLKNASPSVSHLSLDL